MDKNDKTTPTKKMVDELIDDVGADRQRISEFLDKLLSEYTDQSGGIAEHVAKIIDAMTKQHQVRISAIKALGKDTVADESFENDEISREIGRPFEDELREDEN